MHSFETPQGRESTKIFENTFDMMNVIIIEIELRNIIPVGIATQEGSCLNELSNCLPIRHSLTILLKFLHANIFL